MAINNLILIGNGFDLAHGLKTSYGDFIDWYVSNAFKKFQEKHSYKDEFISFYKSNQFGIMPGNEVNSNSQVLQLVKSHDWMQFEFHSRFFKLLYDSYMKRKWVDIELVYFNALKNILISPNNLSPNGKNKSVLSLNSQMEFLKKKLILFLENANKTKSISWKMIDASNEKINKIMKSNSNLEFQTRFLNFNYTDSLALNGIPESQCIHIHGKVSDPTNFPIIFGYGDETDKYYQEMEDSGENAYLTFIKSFGYFKTNSYQRLLTFMDSARFNVFIIGHSCGLSDRVLLSEIFEHPKCDKIELFFYINELNEDNFSELTQEVSRHFKPQNKSLMRRRVCPRNIENIIPQYNEKYKINH